MQPGSRSKVKSSVQRTLRNKLIETYPGLEPHIDEIIPKKAHLEAMKLLVLVFITFLSFFLLACFSAFPDLNLVVIEK
jgi:hypothetical protein